MFESIQPIFTPQEAFRTQFRAIFLLAPNFRDFQSNVPQIACIFATSIAPHSRALASRQQNMTVFMYSI